MHTLGPIMTSTAFGLDSFCLFAAFFSSSLHSTHLMTPVWISWSSLLLHSHLLYCLESFILSTRKDTVTSWSFHFTSIWVQFQLLHCTWVPTMETRLLWYTLLLVLLFSHLLELYSVVYTRVQHASLPCMLHGSVFVVAFWNGSKRRTSGLNLRNHCFKMLKVNVN